MTKRTLALLLIILLSGSAMAQRRRARRGTTPAAREAYLYGKRLWPCFIRARSIEIENSTAPLSKNDLYILIVAGNPLFEVEARKRGCVQ